MLLKLNKGEAGSIVQRASHTPNGKWQTLFRKMIPTFDFLKRLSKHKRQWKQVLPEAKETVTS